MGGSLSKKRKEEEDLRKVMADLVHFDTVRAAFHSR